MIGFGSFASPFLAGVGRANNAGNVGNANNVYGVAASYVFSTIETRSLADNQKTAEHDSATDFVCANNTEV